MLMEKIVFCGDFYYDYPYIAEDIQQIASYIRENHLKLIVNLEAPLVNSEKQMKKRGPALVQGERAIEVLKALNVAGVCLANNHIMDYGEKALEETLRILDDYGIAHCGAGRNLEEARKPMKLVINRQVISILDYGWEVEEVVSAGIENAGAAPLVHEDILEDIRQCVGRKEKTIVNLHWGYEFNLLPQPYDVNFAHEIVDAGAKLVIGHHPHVIQSKETYHGIDIFYSLGNFYFSSRRKDYRKTFPTVYKLECDYGVLAQLDINDWTVETEIIKFDREKEQSYILDKKAYSISDISDQPMNSAYVRLTKKMKNHVNPILTDNEALNKVKLWYLQVFVRKFLRTGWLIKKSLLGK